MPPASDILLVEDDPAHAELARRGLQASPLSLHTVETLSAARAWIESRKPEVILSDLRLPDGSALDLLASGIPLVVMTSQGDERRAVDAMKGGALDYVVKSPEMYRDLPVIVERALRAARAERDRLRAEASLRESEERFRQLADSIEQAFWLYDLGERRMVYTSPAFAKVYRLSDGTAPNAESRLGSVHPDDLAKVGAVLQNGAAPSVREFRVRAGDQIAWVEERTFPIEGPDGRVFRIAGLGQDVSRRRELEAALRQSHKMQAVGQLAGGIAHDFNNMLAAILASGDHLRSLTEVPDQQELCELIVSAAERAAELTQKLLAFSRKGKVMSTPVDVNGVVRESTALLSRSIDRRVRIVTEPSATPITVVGDASQLQNALLNLGINARDAMPSGGELRISTSVRDLDEAACATIPFDVRPGRYVRISVRDTGSGIPPENLQRVFEPFFTTKPVGQGTGLGLAAVYGTVVEHGGAVTVYSDVGRGTVFHLYLPLSESAPPPRVVASHAPRGQGLVLLVDDEPLVRSVGQRLLESLGYEVVVAKDGAEGVRVFENSHDRLVAVLCDLVMPVLSGGDATAAMRKFDPAVPILMCSGFSRDDRAGDVAPSSDAFIAKPFHLTELASALSRVARKPPTLHRDSP